MLASNTAVKQDMLEIPHLSTTLVIFMLNQIIVFEYCKNISLIFYTTHNLIMIDMTHF